MSQHYFTTMHDNELTHVLMGWDRPSQGFFMVIEKPGDNDTPYWSNLTHLPSPHPKSPDIFFKLLEIFGITIPHKMIKGVLQDGIDNVGNKQVFHEVE